MKYKNISVFLPTYNESENIKQAILSIQKFLKKNFLQYEIIIVNDGSNDDTKKIVTLLAQSDKRIKLINHKKNLGYGAALRTGFNSTKYDLVFYTDADNQFDINDLTKVLPLTKKYDIISGYRIRRQDPLMRIFISSVYNIIISIIFRMNIRDIDSSFKLYKKKVLDALTLKSNTGLIDAEVFIKARKKGFTIGQIGVNHYPRLKGKSIYEMGNRNKIVAFVKPKVITDIFNEIKILRGDLS